MFGKLKVALVAGSLGMTSMFYLADMADAVPTNKAGAQYATCVAQGKALMQKGQYPQAVQKLEVAVVQSPDNCEGHLMLGQAYCKVKNYGKAKQQFRTAIRVGKGSPNAQKANQALMQLPAEFLKPRTGPETRMIASMLGLSRVRGADGACKPTVIDFYASWCQPCKQLKPVLDKMKTEYGDKVSFMSVDVDDPNNERLIDQYEVSPIPTLVFLNPEGEVVTFTVGFSGEGRVSESMKKIVDSPG